MADRQTNRQEEHQGRRDSMAEHNTNELPQATATAAALAEPAEEKNDQDERPEEHSTARPQEETGSTSTAGAASQGVTASQLVGQAESVRYYLRMAGRLRRDRDRLTRYRRDFYETINPYKRRTDFLAIRLVDGEQNLRERIKRETRALESWTLFLAGQPADTLYILGSTVRTIDDAEEGSRNEVVALLERGTLAPEHLERLEQAAAVCREIDEQMKAEKFQK